MKRLLLLSLCQLAWSLNAAQADVQTAKPSSAPQPLLITSRYTNVPTPVLLNEGPQDSSIVRMVAALLQKQHYSQKPLDATVASNFFTRYLDSLDNLHIYFIKSDLDEFEKYRPQLVSLLVEKGDSRLGRVVFDRFRLRLAQQYEYTQDMLLHEKFEFTGDERFAFDRKKLPRPADLVEAKLLWRDRLRYEYLQEKLNKEKHPQIVTNLTRRYTRVLRTLNEYDNDDVLQIYLTALSHVYDPHTDYMGKSESENFYIGMNLSLYGIGARLQSEDGICKIVDLTPESPAEKSKKLKGGDRIIAVAQSNGPPVDVVDMKLNKVVELIRGPKDTEVRLTVIPVDANDPSVRKIVPIIRAEIKLEESAAKARVFEMPQGKDAGGKAQSIRLGVIDLPSFYAGFEQEGRKKASEPRSTTTDVARLLTKLMKENVAGVVLDLRRNGGGSLEEAINLTGLFIKEGPVVQVKGWDGKIFVDSDPDPTVFYDGPLVVLTSRFSASASEILAGALQDYGRALVVGDTSTHGKGTVQSLLALKPILRQNNIIITNDPGSLKITIRKFYRASGASTQLKGVVPDIILPSVANAYDVGEASLDNPLLWDTIIPAPYEKLDRVVPHLPELKKRSESRTATDADFRYIREEFDRYKKQQADKTVSLNEKVRLNEKKEADDRAKVRKKELASRPEVPGKIYDITLKLVDEPGLPAPTVRTNSVSSTNAVKKGLASGKATNSAPTDVAEVKTFNPDPDEDDTADANVPVVDPTLDETRRILVDYISFLAKKSGVAASRPGGKGAVSN